jgi:hypothetical protein
MYNRENPDGFKLFAHDAETTMRKGPWFDPAVSDELYRDRTGPFTGFDEFGEPIVLLFPFPPHFRMCDPCQERVWSVDPSTWNPQWAHMQLMAHPQYQMAFADAVHRQFFNGGVFTPEANDARWMSRASEIDLAIIAESARWGDTRGSELSTRNEAWLEKINSIRYDYFPFRTDIVFDQIKARGWFPATDAPVFAEQHGGAVASGPFTLTINNPNGSGTIYYTLDGSDPRGKATLNPPTAAPVLPGAIAYGGAITLTETAHVTARVLDGGEWSALNEATFVLPALGSNLRVTEMMYHPQNPDSLAEYIELQNVGGEPINLINTEFTEGIHFTFPQMIVAPGEYVVLVRNAEVFDTVYGPGHSVIGEYVGALDDAGERIRLEDPTGATILDFEFDDEWYPSTDGEGFSLVVLDVEGSFDDVANWCVSSATGGTPGAPDAIGCAPQASLNVEPLSLNASSDAGTFELIITNTADGLLDWSAEIVLGESWLSLDVAQGQDDGMVRGSYAANGLFVERVGTIRVTAIDASGSPREITITQAAATAIISVAPARIEFGAVNVGSSATGGATVTNTGDVAIEGIAATSPPFTIESGEAYTVLPGESHEVVVRFTPIGNGAVSGALRLSGGGSAVVVLLAEGLLDNPDADISVTPLQVDFESVDVGSSATQTLTVTNGGQIVLEGVASTSPPYSIVSGQTYTIFPGASHEVVVRFTPTESGASNGSLSLSGGGGATATLLGSGTAEDEPALSLCEASDLLQSEFDALKIRFGISDIDFDADGFPEFYALALAKAVCPLDVFFEIGTATSTAFDINLMALAGEGPFAELLEYKHAIAALMFISGDTQAALRAALSADGIELSGTYEVVTGIDGAFMPAALPGKTLEEGYLIFDSIAKGENEPYSASGDFDGDGVSNLDEYLAVVVNGGGSLEDFINAATGGEGSEGEGEGEGEPPGCGAMWIGGDPINKIGDALILLLAGGALIALRSRRLGVRIRQ